MQVASLVVSLTFAFRILFTNAERHAD